MLRPATPLSLLLGAAFALLLLSVLSTPVIQVIPLSLYKGVSFGVFGYCQSTGCSNIGIGYDVENLFPRNSQSFELSDNVRNTLTSILVLHPIAAFLTLVVFVLAVVAHAHAPSHSARFLLIFFIFNLLDFLVCLAAFVIDVLLFIPHMAWGTYVVLAATILVFLSGLVSCAMRRTLVSRKSRQKKIADNAEMSGENYYNRENQPQKPSFALTSQPTIPMVSGANGVHDNISSFAAFENQKKDDQVSDERIPLTQRTTSERSSNTMHTMHTMQAVPVDTANPGAIGVAINGPSRSASQDRYGNYVNGPPDAYGGARSPPYERMNRGGRRDTDPAGGYRGGRGGGYGPPQMRGRGGGYGPPGRGGYGPRGGRGGYGPSPRGSYGPGSMMRGGGRTPPPGYNNMAGQYERRPYPDAPGPYGGHQPPPSEPSLSHSGSVTYSAYHPDLDLPRAESPPPLPGSEPDIPIGQAIEMDATPAAGASSFGQYGQIRDCDTDVAGMVGLQQGNMSEPHETYVSEPSRYEEEQDVPPRAAWNQGPGRNTPLAGPPADAPRLPAAEVSGRNTPTAVPRNDGNYYEDIDPRFDQEHNNHAHQQQQQQQQVAPPPPPPPAEPDYDEMRSAASGARSPTGSERSNFTSISQRGVNPRWNSQPPMPPHGGNGPPSRRPVPQRQDILLDNPDFQVPGTRSAAAGPRGTPGMIPGSSYPTGPL